MVGATSIAHIIIDMDEKEFKKYKEECRRIALEVQSLSVPVDWEKDNLSRTAKELLDMVLILTAQKRDENV